MGGDCQATHKHQVPHGESSGSHEPAPCASSVPPPRPQKRPPPAATVERTPESRLWVGSARQATYAHAVPTPAEKKTDATPPKKSSSTSPAYSGAPAGPAHSLRVSRPEDQPHLPFLYHAAAAATATAAAATAAAAVGGRTTVRRRRCQCQQWRHCGAGYSQAAARGARDRHSRLEKSDSAGRIYAQPTTMTRDSIKL